MAFHYGPEIPLTAKEFDLWSVMTMEKRYKEFAESKLIENHLNKDIEGYLFGAY